MDADRLRQELRDHYDRSRAALLAAIENLSDADMTEPSIDAWSVKDHLAHLTVWDEIRRAEIERISAGGEPAWRSMSHDDVETFNSLTSRMRSSLPLDQVRAELASSRARMLEAIAAATEGGLDEGRYGEAGLRSDHELEHADIIRTWRDRRS